MTDKVKETTEYESLMGVQEKPNADLTSFMPELDEVVVEEPWKKHWKEMPEYKQEDNQHIKQYMYILEIKKILTSFVQNMQV